MPKIVYTIKDVKALIAEKNGVDAHNVEIFENGELSLCFGQKGEDLDNESYIFQISNFNEKKL